MPYYAPQNDDEEFEFDAGLISIIQSSNNDWDNMKDINDPCEKAAEKKSAK
jgi:hypothetical protein